MDRNELKYLNYIERLLLLIEKILRRLKIDLRFKELYAISDYSNQNNNEKLPIYRELTLNDFYRQSTINPQWFHTEKIKDMEKAFSIEGNRAFGIFDNELLIAYGWFSTVYFDITDKQLNDGDAYIWDDYTHPHYRGKHLHENIIKIRLNELSELNIKRILAVTRFQNKRSSIGFKKQNFALIQRFFTIKFFNNKEYSTLKY